ncbi:tetratricopeptide repeat protein 28-like [Montipora capricornis]|uniref:tetratricopeptide repeat protein 28-like n=1 Tax=Montipora capricornis TaxID=246305 RepID=UPI0035F1B7A7
MLIKVWEISKVGDRAGEGKAYGNLGNTYQSLGDFKQAIKYHQQDLRIAKEVWDRVGEGRAYCNLGNAYQSLGDFRQAIEYHKQHLSIATELGDISGAGKAYGNLGNAYQCLGDFKQALEYTRQDLNIAKEVGDKAAEGRAYGNLGNAYQSLGDFKQAIKYHKQDLSIAKEVEDRVGEGGAYCNLGNAYQSVGNFAQAIEYHKQDLCIAKEVGDRAGEGRGFCNLGNAYKGLRKFEQAIEYYKQYLCIAKDVGDRAGELRAYGNLGNAYDNLGSFIKEAMECHKQYLCIAKEVGHIVSAGRGYCNLGTCLDNLGIFKEAMECYKQHLIIAKEVGDRAGEGRAYCNFGNTYYNLGDLEEAMKYQQQHLSITIEVGDRVNEGRAHGNVSNIYGDLGDFEKAMEYNKKGLSIAKEVGDMAGQGRACGILGNAYRRQGDIKQALEYTRQDLDIAKKLGDKAAEGRAYGDLGNTYYDMGELENALLFSKQQLSISKEREDPIGQGIACYRIGRIHEFSGSLCKALNYYRLSVNYYDKTRSLLQSEDEWKISFRDKTRFAYTALWTALLKNEDFHEALFAAEQGRAQALADILTLQYRVDDKPSAVTMKETISAVMKDLCSQIVFTALDGNTISFWLLREGSEIKFRQKELENGTPDSLMETFHSLSLSVNSLQALYDVLVSPIADLLQDDDLVFVPDGPFWLAPYSALSDSVRIRIIPSLTALKVIAGATDEFYSKSEALLVGDPYLEEVTYGTGEPMFEQLPCAKKEVEVIGELLHTSPLTGRNATKAEVLKRMKSVALIHIAAHGDGELGEIVLAPNPERTSQKPEEEDYMLTMSDVYAVRLQARLVVLSCCHSGQGEVKSEGVVGIARAFLCAGARSVLVSLWAIDDEATLLFMKIFYQHLADRKSASLALHHAMKSLRETEKYSAIKYWAPFVLIGDDVTFEFGQHRHAKNEPTSKT